jgi:7,8-dihydropterin-6-yl-methyl-4-(beta-D-ribofuranosyl)aminobenzene 5'-phosphate synthase
VTDFCWGEHATADHVKHRGLVLLSSCGDAGIIHALLQIQQAPGIDEVYTVVGG